VNDIEVEGRVSGSGRIDGDSLDAAAKYFERISGAASGIGGQRNAKDFSGETQGKRTVSV
jgi:hypothetical protein